MSASFLHDCHKRIRVRREGEFSRAILFLFELGYLLIDGGGRISRTAIALRLNPLHLLFVAAKCLRKRS
jgi:hypothetical protein